MTTFIPTKINAKASKAGKTYWEIETNAGKATCFDYPMVQVLEASIGKPISLYDIETNEKGFNNLRPHKAGSETQQPIVQAQQTQQQVMPVQDAFKDARIAKDVSMFASYAKDIFLELCRQEFQIRTYDKAQGGASNEEMMKRAIALVKQAKVSFERTEIFQEQKAPVVLLETHA